MDTRHTRRKFLGGLGAAGVGIAVTGGSSHTAWAASRAPERDVSMLDQYFLKFGEILATFEEREMDAISRSADMAVLCIDWGGKLYSGLRGHIFQGDGGETAADRIGNPVLFSRDVKKIKSGDFLITMNVSQAEEAKQKGVKVVGFTSPFSRKEDTPPLGLENPQDKILSEICDITIQCHVPYTDGILTSDRIHVHPIPASGQMTIIVYWALAGAITGRLAKKGKQVQVAGSLQS